MLVPEDTAMMTSSAVTISEQSLRHGIYGFKRAMARGIIIVTLTQIYIPPQGGVSVPVEAATIG